MQNNDSSDCWEHDFLKEIVRLVRAEFYRAGGGDDSDKLIEELLTGGKGFEADSNDG